MKYDLSLIAASKFGYRDVMEAFHIADYEQTAAILSSWEEEKRIRPILSSGKISFQPYFYQRYQKLQIKVDHEETRAKIRKLNPALISFYLDHVTDYEKYEPMIQQLSQYLYFHKEELNNPALRITVKERSYAIFGDEKFLERNRSSIPLTYSELNCEPTFEPFFTKEINSEANEILVLENRDPWDSIASVLADTHSKIFLHHHFSLIIYGEGNKVTQKDPSGSLHAYLSGRQCENDTILYCGDIDRAGINIFSRLKTADPDLRIQPFTELYQEMIHRAPEDLVLLEDTDDRRDQKYDASFLSYFQGNDQKRIKEVLDRNKRVPQEILSRADLRRLAG